MESWELAAREACRDTLAQYTHAGDRGRLDQFAETFCEDGVLEIRGSPPVEGRPAIVQRIREVTLGQSTPADRPGDGVAVSRSIVRHNVTNVWFMSVSPAEALVASYFTVFTEIGLDHLGRYRDRLVPVGHRWLFAHRFVSVDWYSPESLFGS